MSDVDDVMRHFAEQLDAAAKAEALAAHYEKRIAVVEAEQMDTSLPEWKAKALARKTEAYKEALDQHHQADEAARTARGRVVHTAARVDIWRSRMATLREERRAARGSSGGQRYG